MSNETIKAAATVAGYSRKAAEMTDVQRQTTALIESAKEVRAFLGQQEKLAWLAAVAGVAFVCAVFAAQYNESRKPAPSPNFKTKKP